MFYLNLRKGLRKVTGAFISETIFISNCGHAALASGPVTGWAKAPSNRLGSG